jgi:DNA-binding transcriptional regulator YbjK
MYIKSNKRKLQSPETKNRILDIAHQKFKEKGFNNVTIEDIAESAEISVGSLYYHFKNKYEILIEWHSCLDELYNKHMKKLTSDPKFKGSSTINTIKEMLLYMNETCIYYGQEYIATIYLYMLSNSDFAKIMTDRRRTYYKIMTELFKPGAKKGRNNSKYTIKTNCYRYYNY